MATHAIRERWLACETCGAALSVPIEGGTVPCLACGATLEAPPRPDTRLARTPASDEPGRIARLRAQDGTPFKPPPGFEGLVANNEAPPEKLAEARKVWGASRRWVLGNPGDVEVGDRLTWLTMILRNTLEDARQKRALVEGALEALSIPRHRQLMLGFLTRGAALEHDVESARLWLDQCDPGSEDLRADSAYRISKAMLETVRSDFSSVIQVLGATEEEVPIDDSMDPVAVVLRANALERSGRVDAAQVELTKFMTRGGKSAAIEYVIASMPREWSLCAQSIHVGRTEARTAVGERAVAQSGAGMGWLMIVSGVLVPGIMLAVFVGGDQLDWPMLIVLVVPVIMGALGIRMILRGRRAREIAEHGLHGRGRILAVESTGTKINGTPLLRFDVEVKVEGHSPVVASAKLLMRGGGHLVGKDVPVIWHPKYPTEVVLSS